MQKQRLAKQAFTYVHMTMQTSKFVFQVILVSSRAVVRTLTRSSSALRRYETRENHKEKHNPEPKKATPKQTNHPTKATNQYSHQPNKSHTHNGQKHTKTPCFCGLGPRAARYCSRRCQMWQTNKQRTKKKHTKKTKEHPKPFKERSLYSSSGGSEHVHGDIALP